MRSYNDLNRIYYGGSLNIDCNEFNSLLGTPKHITGSFGCDKNELTSLVGGPELVDGSYTCSYNQLTDLVGCASHIGRNLYLSHNRITSLVGIHKIIKQCNGIVLNDYKIKEGGIGLLLIDDLKYIEPVGIHDTVSPPFAIIKRYLGTGTKGMMACSKELIDNGYQNYAKL